MNPPVLFALGFANLPMLAGLAAASIPIILHLLNKRRFREERWAAMRFLLAAIRKNQKRIRIEQWLLLAVRTLIVVCVVSAMAKPFLERFIPVLAGRRTHRVLVLDGSLSMGTKAAESNRFEQAKDLASRLVKDARPGDALSLVVMGEPPHVVIGAPATNHAEVLKELGDVTLPHGSTDLTASLVAIDRVLEASTIPQKEVVILSDLQAASWRKTSANDPGLKRALARLESRRTRSVVIDLGTPGGSNRAVTDMRLDAPIVVPGLTPAPLLTATVRNFGHAPADNLQVRMVVDGQVGPEQVISVPGGEGRDVVFNTDLAAPGEHLLEVRIDDDPLPLDNKRWLSVPVREALKVLLIDGDPKTESFRSETDYLAAALSPESDSEGLASPIQVEVAPESQLARRDLSTIDVVVLANIANLTATEAAALDAFLKLGGGVVVFGGDQVRADSYNAVLKDLLPAEVGPPVGDPDSQGRFEFKPLGFKHPIVAEFAGADAGVTSSLTNVKTARFHKLLVPEGSTARVVLAFSNDDPAIVEATRHRGRVVQVATSANVGWTDWPIHLSFAPVMQQIALFAASGRLAERNVRVGQPLDQALPSTASEAVATITRPDRKPVTSKLLPSGDVSRLHFEGTDLSGPYAVRVGIPLNLDATFAANPDPAESDPAKLDRNALSDALPGWTFDYRNDLNALLNDAASVSRRGELHRPFLWTVLLLLVAESCLAWWFGHHR